MLITAQSKFIRTSPRKTRLVVDAIRGLKPDQALELLKHLKKRAATPVYKVLKQAVANAVNNLNQTRENLLIQSIQVNQGPTHKRWNPVSRGRAHAIQKKTSHIKVVLISQEPKKPKPKKVKPKKIKPKKVVKKENK